MSNIKSILDGNGDNAAILTMPMITIPEIAYLEPEQRASILLNRLFIFPCESAKYDDALEALLIALTSVSMPFVTNLMDPYRIENSNMVPTLVGFSSKEDLIKFRLALKGEMFDIL